MDSISLYVWYFFTVKLSTNSILCLRTEDICLKEMLTTLILSIFFYIT